MTEKFITIPRNSFTILIGSRDFLTGTLADVPAKFRPGRIVYIHFQGRLHLPLSSVEQDRIEYRQERNIIDIIPVLKADSARLIIFEYNSAWFYENEGCIGFFGYLCRERSRNRQEVLFISETFDSVISELEPMADKLVCVKDILSGRHDAFCNLSCPVTDPAPGNISSRKVKLSRQQCLIC